jgi:hypothetical protein
VIQPTHTKEKHNTHKIMKPQNDRSGRRWYGGSNTTHHTTNVDPIFWKKQKLVQKQENTSCKFLQSVYPFDARS